jgi:hypothetical protein
METRGYTKKEVQTAQQKVSQGVRFVSVDLDATVTEEIIKLGEVAGRISVQATGTLVGSYEVSLNGVDFVAAGAIAAGSISDYSSTMAAAIKVKRTGGAGKAVVLAK